ncbi:16S rRNA (guanine(966)-N(2))-methyltransferase RsmD [Lysobacter solisilvae (ex Woo and Kim 2020)]|uniref:Ribosomal RNA small subunit methyltransferase D n=1 Tax=Agrilutibacter terrestris TaxID=2865112 RepID=A0A7H0FVS7_9GAMM|nr:16S rRNA (guanine(966)-N(2))-methyltransferase RsmD [Lysobacter terrestris]QNP40143.1 16S rRNA (guanine(966)-N(2))-methyltransferase RsmD [Lysobacter terrestris]
MNRPRSSSMPAAPGRVRIIGGRWRGTRLDVPMAPGLRPTSDRVRETLFNWLQPVLPGARVLDLFAGSGALGLEALSRGAASAVLVERDAKLAAALRTTATRLQGGEAANVVCADALGWLHGQPEAGFDLAFVDPPFDANVWAGVLPLLAPKLARNAWLYVEAPHAAVAAPPAEWALHREGSTREVRYALYRRRADAAVDAGGGATATLAPNPAGPAATSPI